MKLALIYPEIECSITNTNTYSIPLGLGSIATYCKEKNKDLEVEILDGSLISHKEQLERIEKFNPDVTGISSTIASQHNAYEIAQKTKDLDSKVFFGGVNSTNLWENMLRNRDFIDGVILYDGEIPMSSALEKIKKDGDLDNCNIPNLSYRDSKRKIQEPPQIYIPNLEEIPDIDYSFFEMGRFLEITQEKGFGKAITYYAGKGCTKRSTMKLEENYSFEEYNKLVAQMNTCSFCGRNELGLRNMPQDREARIVRNLNDKYNITGFFNVQDTVNIKNISPIGLDDCWFRLFIGTESINQENIRKLKQRYGLSLIFQAGIESADPIMRENYRKSRTNYDDTISKVELMAREGIQLHASFILGGRGETEFSIRETTNLVKKLAQYENVTWILVSPQIILPGSPDYKKLLENKKMERKYSKQDLIDLVGISRDFIKIFCPTLTREFIMYEIKETFDDIRKQRQKDLVFDVKGVVPDEERFINPNRQYC